MQSGKQDYQPLNRHLLHWSPADPPAMAAARPPPQRELDLVV